MCIRIHNRTTTTTTSVCTAARRIKRFQCVCFLSYRCQLPLLLTVVGVVVVIVAINTCCHFLYRFTLMTHILRCLQYIFFAISIRTFSIHHYSGWTLMETNELMRSLNQFRLRRTLAPFCISLEDNSNSLEWMIQRQIAFERSHKPRDLYPNYRKHLPNTQRSTTVHFVYIRSKKFKFWDILLKPNE